MTTTKVSVKDLQAGDDVFIYRATYTVQSITGRTVTLLGGEQINATGATRFLVVR